MSKVIWKFASVQFVRKVSLLEGFFILDGMVNACKFLKEYVIYNASKEKSIIDESQLQEYRNNVIKQCSKLYTLGVVDRYLMYSVMYINFLMLDWLLSSVGSSNISNILFATHCVLTIPNIQNGFVKVWFIDRIVSRLIENKEIFIKYSLSKIIISNLKGLDKGISEIKNYHILMIYHHLSFNYIYEFTKSYCFIHLLHYLRQSEVMYYYYKAIKLAYYYKSGYLFNVISRQDSLYIINIIINEKRWSDLVKVEVVNALYSMMSRQVDLIQDTTIWFWYISKFHTVWSIICLLKLVNIYVNTTILAIYLSNQAWNENEQRINLKKLLVGGVIYVLILLNTNDLIISIVLLGQDILYTFVDELIFFIKNEKDIKKVINHFEKRVISK